MKASKSLLDKPTTGWKEDLPLPQTAENEPLAPIGKPPNFADDICLELHTSCIMGRSGGVVILVAGFLFNGYLLWLFYSAMGFRALMNPFTIALLLVGSMVGIGMLRLAIAPPRDEPIRFNRKRGKVYLYRFHSGRAWRRKGWGVRPVAFDWADLRAEAWSRMASTGKGFIFSWGVDIAVVEPGTNHVIDRFQLAHGSVNGEHMWAMARAFMNQGPDALPKYPRPPRDWNNDVPWYNLPLRLAPKVAWPEDMDRESRTAP